MLTGCKGKDGEAGAAGPAGVAGVAGATGTAGADMNATCTECHDLSTDMYAKIVQWNASVHATGGNFERNSTSCAPCHTHEGFTEVLSTGATSTVASIENPTPQNCRTCHNIHTNYDATDFALSTEAPVTLWLNGATVDFGKGNLCANCHQPRVPSPMPVIGGADVDITSGYWGTHYGAQAAILGGTGGFEIAGSETYTNSYHTTGVADGCIECHMAAPYGDQARGHTMNMTYDYHGSEKANTAGCETSGCHTGFSDFDYNGYQTEIQGLLDELRDSLLANNIIDSSDHIVPNVAYTANQAGAFINYYLILEDRSLGVHNTKYSRALLTNSIETF